MRMLVIGDVHVKADRVPWGALFSRRVLAVLNHRLRRGKHFKPALLAGFVERMVGEAKEGAVDALVCTGDVTTTALADEFGEARAALEPVRSAVVDDGGQAWIVPGNHDRYTFTSRRRRRLEKVMTGWGPGASEGYPAERELCEGWRLLMLDSASPNVYSSRGRLGRGQMVALKRALDGLEEGQGLVVMCHYPPGIPGAVEGVLGEVVEGVVETLSEPWGRRLAESEAVMAMLREARGRVVWLHGHVHRPWWWGVSGAGKGDAEERLAEDDAPHRARGAGVGMVNAGCPCWVDGKWPGGQGYWALELGVGKDGAWVAGRHRV